VHDSTELRNRAFAGFRELLGRLAQRQPVVAFIDDLQWADRDSFALLQALLGHTGVPGLLLVATCRPIPQDDALAASLREIAAHPAVRSMKVGPLSPEAATALVDSLADSGEIAQPVKQRLAEAVVQEAGGNPLFTLELIRYLCDVVLPRGGPADLLPGIAVSLDALIVERLRRLPVESQRLIEIIAVAGVGRRGRCSARIRGLGARHLGAGAGPPDPARGRTGIGPGRAVPPPHRRGGAGQPGCGGAAAVAHWHRARHGKMGSRAHRPAGSLLAGG
jgi:hypothetical protein